MGEFVTYLPSNGTATARTVKVKSKKLKQTLEAHRVVRC
jgi:hypothetical protein